jgi:regulator of protease activity HflC (stomatin/prohibitin superfamily)
MGWIIFLAIAVPLIAVIAWLSLDESFVRVEPGQLGLLLIKGKATDKALGPGPHWVPALRRRMVQSYPSVELSYRAAPGEQTAPAELERSGPPVRAALSDRSGIMIAYTVRFRLDTQSLRTVHDRFGPDGIWAAVRDVSERALTTVLGTADVEEFFGPARLALQQRLADAVTADLGVAGIVVTMFTLGTVDLGRTGEVIEATSRARHELERERAEAEMRLARAQIDADLGPFVDGPNAGLALRYREVDSWRELARTHDVVVPPSVPAASSAGGSSTRSGDTTDAVVDTAPVDEGA